MITQKLDILINKIYLVYIPCPNKKDYEEYIFPNGLLYLYSSLLNNKYNTDLIMLGKHDFTEFLSEIQKDDIIGISVNSSNKNISFEFAQYIKKSIFNVKIIMGGPFISLLDDEKLKEINFVDNFFKFESEYSILNFLKSQNNNKIIYGERIKELDSIPFPSKNGAIYSNIITSRGCPGNCIYCSSPELWKRKLFFRSPENIIEEIEQLYFEGVDYFSFSDDTFTFDKNRIIKLCNIIREKNLKIIFDIRSRIDAVDNNILEELALTGCVSISFGVESASPKIQNILSKKVDIKKAVDIIKKCRSLYIKTNVFLIIGNPEEKDIDIDMNIDFIKESLSDWITVSGLHYYPQTALYKLYPKNIDWINQKNTVYFDDLYNIKKNELKIHKAHKKALKNLYEKTIDLTDNIPYRSVFWKYAELGMFEKNKKLKLKWLRKAFEIYESPEILFSLGIEENNEEMINKAYYKFCFQINNDIRKSPDFLKNALVFFEYVEDKEYCVFVKSLLEKVI